MPKRANAYPELAELRVGRRFRQRPGDAVVKEFLGHVWNTGSPHTWRWIATTSHPLGEAPLILSPFAIPERLRSGRVTRAPCSICSPEAPKFDHGFLVLCSDGYVRIIGHECGHDYFTGDSYAAALKEHEDEHTEATARELLAARMPDLGRTLLEAVTVARALREFLDLRERAFAGVTHRAIGELQKLRVGDQLTVNVDTQARDERGRHVIGRHVVAVLPSGTTEALAPRAHLLAELAASIQDAATVWIVESGELAERVAAFSRREAFAAAKSVRRLDTALGNACATLGACRALFSLEGLQAISKWGRHMHCPAPFWIEIVDRRVFLGKGLRPAYWDRRHFLTLPTASFYQAIEVG